MNIPDYISPVVGYRVWLWDDAGIRSLNGERWHPGKPLAAGCRIVSRHAEVVQGTHDTPQADCTCGIYATQSPEHLHRTGYDLRGICGAVCCGARWWNTNSGGVRSLLILRAFA